MTAYDQDERIQPPAPSFLSRRPTGAELRRLRRLIAALPPAPPLVFWPESARLDGPWPAGADRPQAPLPPAERPVPAGRRPGMVRCRR